MMLKNAIRSLAGVAAISFLLAGVASPTIAEDTSAREETITLDWGEGRQTIGLREFFVGMTSFENEWSSPPSSSGFAIIWKTFPRHPAAFEDGRWLKNVTIKISFADDMLRFSPLYIENGKIAVGGFVIYLNRKRNVLIDKAVRLKEGQEEIIEEERRAIKITLDGWLDLGDPGTDNTKHFLELISATQENRTAILKGDLRAELSYFSSYFSEDEELKREGLKWEFRVRDVEVVAP